MRLPNRWSPRPPSSAPKLGKKRWSRNKKLLQRLLRAEATFRDIQVAFGGQGQGGGGSSAGRDLANLFDLEMDTEKNQYETGNQQSGSSEAKEKAVDEALQKLEQLAQRQKALAEQEAKSKQQTFEQRWQQEMLRREAEELKKQMEQLSREGSPSSGAGQKSFASADGWWKRPVQFRRQPFLGPKPAETRRPERVAAGWAGTGRKAARIRAQKPSGSKEHLASAITPTTRG